MAEPGKIETKGPAQRYAAGAVCHERCSTSGGRLFCLFYRPPVCVLSDGASSPRLCSWQHFVLALLNFTPSPSNDNAQRCSISPPTSGVLTGSRYPNGGGIHRKASHRAVETEAADSGVETRSRSARGREKEGEFPYWSEYDSIETLPHVTTPGNSKNDISLGILSRPDILLRFSQTPSRSTKPRPCPSESIAY